MADQQIPETKNSDAPGDQDQAAQQAPAEVDGLAAKAEQSEKETEETADRGVTATIRGPGGDTLTEPRTDRPATDEEEGR
mgnify:CR=1 FL=1